VWDAASHQLPSGPWRHLLFLALFGRLAVALFIVISGFCLMLPVSRRELDLRGGVPRFFAKRARRILPPYYASIVLALLLLPVRVGKWDLLSHLLLIQNLDPTRAVAINGVLWSIAVEWQIYFWFPLFL